MQGSTTARQQAVYYAAHSQQHAQETTALIPQTRNAVVDMESQVAHEGIDCHDCSLTVDMRTQSGQIFTCTVAIYGFLVIFAFWSGVLLGTFAPKK